MIHGQLRGRQRRSHGTSTIGKPAFQRVVLAQSVATLVAGLIGAGVDWIWAYSALLGGFTAVIPNGYFAFRVFAHQGAQSAARIVRAFYWGEAAKLGLTVAMFCLVFVLVRPLNVAALFGAFVVVQAVGWAASARLAAVAPKRDV